MASFFSFTELTDAQGQPRPPRRKFKVVPRENGGFEIRGLNDPARATHLPLWRYDKAKNCVQALRRFAAPCTVYVFNAQGVHVITKEIEGGAEYGG